jgi:hypothetical protein
MNTTRPDSDASLPLAAEWYARIAQARTAAELVEVCRAFLEGWNPVDLARLPPGVRPGGISTLEEIAGIAYDLAQERLRTHLPHDAERLATRMHAFFSHAAARAALLASHRTLP